MAVNKYRLFVTASEKCGVTQPTLSMMIQKLGSELAHILGYTERCFIKFNTNETTFGVANVNVGYSQNESGTTCSELASEGSDIAEPNFVLQNWMRDLVVVGDKGNSHDFSGLDVTIFDKEKHFTWFTVFPKYVGSKQLLQSKSCLELLMPQPYHAKRDESFRV